MSAFIASTTRHLCLRKQRGAVLMVMLVLLVIATTTIIVNALSHSGLQNEREQITSQSLTQAKEALIGYAATYGDNNANDVFGYLPLPDLGNSRNNNMLFTEGNAAANFTGNTKNLTVIGRLPWRKLGLSALRDSQGECLWYAVSGSFQEKQKAKVLNWDSLGHFDTYSSNGTSAGTVSTTGTSYMQHPVAIIFSARTVLQGQNRQTSITDNVSICGGNYDARNYLDSFNSDININNIVNYFVGPPNSSTGYAYNLNNLSDGSLLSTADLTSPKNIISGNIEVNIAGNIVKIVNDKILTITADEIFRPIIHRIDFKAQISTLMNDPYFQTFPNANITGTKGTNNISCGSVGSTQTQKFCNNWKEMLLLKQLSMMYSVKIDGALQSGCNKVLIFGGKRISPQLRATATDKSGPANYLEAPNFAAFTGPSGNFIGSSTFNVNNPSADLLKCL